VFAGGCSKQDRVLVEFDPLWDYDDPAATEEKFRGLLPLAETSDNTSYHLQLLTQIARAEGLQGKFDEAHSTLDEVEAQMDEAPDIVKIRYLLERGRVFNSSGQPAKARPLFLEAWNIAESTHHDSYAVDAAHMMGIVEEPDAALDWNEKALMLAESSTDPKAQKWLGALYNNIGWTYHDQAEYEKALDLFERGLAWRQEQGQEKETRIAKWCVARALRSLERTEEALTMQEALLAEWNEAGESSGYVYEELGECHLDIGNTQEAEKYFALAYEQLSRDQWLVENQPERLARLRELGGFD
jgi:tetratricopeptide (TPR) repeat protein